MWPGAMLTLTLVLLWTSRLVAAEVPEWPCAPDDEECWDALEDEGHQIPPLATPFGSDPEPTVIGLPCRLQWAPVTTCLLTEATGDTRHVPCTPLAYHVFVRRVPADYGSTYTLRIPHPTTEATCAALGLTAGQSYAVAIRAAGVQETFTAPVKRADLSKDLYVSISAPGDQVPPGPMVLSLAPKPR